MFKMKLLGIFSVLVTVQAKRTCFMLNNKNLYSIDTPLKDGKAFSIDLTNQKFQQHDKTFKVYNYETELLAVNSNDKKVLLIPSSGIINKKLDFAVELFSKKYTSSVYPGIKYNILDKQPVYISDSTLVKNNDNEFIYFGGALNFYANTTNSTSYIRKNARIFNIHKNTWSPPYPSDIKRSGHTSVAYNKIVYIIGGSQDITYSESSLILDTFKTTEPYWETVISTGTPPSLGYNYISVQNQHKIYLLGGITYNNDQNNSNYVYELNLESLVWTKYYVAGLETIGTNSCGVFYDNSILITTDNSLISIDIDTWVTKFTSLY